VEATVGYARFLESAGEREAALRWFRWAAVRADHPTAKPATLQEIVESEQDRSELDRIVGAPGFEALRTGAFAEARSAPETALEVTEIRALQRKRRQAWDRLDRAERKREAGDAKGAAKDLAKAIAELRALRDLEWRGLIHLLAVARARALGELGESNEALATLAQVALAVRGCPFEFSRAYAAALLGAGRPEEALRWARRACAANPLDEASRELLADLQRR
jgi:tetratricopeptide (TPR) repeat protein